MPDTRMLEEAGLHPIASLPMTMDLVGEEAGTTYTRSLRCSQEAGKCRITWAPEPIAQDLPVDSPTPRANLQGTQFAGSSEILAMVLVCGMPFMFWVNHGSNYRKSAGFRNSRSARKVVLPEILAVTCIAAGCIHLDRWLRGSVDLVNVYPMVAPIPPMCVSVGLFLAAVLLLGMLVDAVVYRYQDQIDPPRSKPKKKAVAVEGSEGEDEADADADASAGTVDYPTLPRR